MKIYVTCEGEYLPYRGWHVKERYRISEADIVDVKKLSNDGVHMLRMVYLLLFSVDLEDEEQEPVKACDYEISIDLAKELIAYSVNEFGDDAVELNLMWMNLGPSMRKDFARTEISERIPAGVARIMKNVS